MRCAVALAAAAGLAGSAVRQDPSDARIIDEALQRGEAYENLVHLCDRIGHRLSGSPSLDRAIDWAADVMRRAGLENVRKEKVVVPVWVRGEEHAEILEPGPHKLSILGLGGSVATPEGGLVADAVAVRSFAEFGPHVRGKIVVCNAPFTTYGETRPYRTFGAIEAAKHGAIAVLVRSIGPVSLDTPHAGAMSYQEGIEKIPAAAVTIEGAELVQRLQDRGVPVRIRLVMNARVLDDAPSANVVGELPGEKADEVVLLAAHLDSWDVGQGAHDDGAGCVEVIEAARLLKATGVRPRRTIRVVLYTNEENGLAGGRAYRDAHLEELPDHVAAIESDSGGGRPLGFGLTMPDSARQEAALARLRGHAGGRLAALGADRITPGGGGADIGPLREKGVPTMSLRPDTSRYFDIHHTRADTIDKIDPEAVAQASAALAIMTWALADMEGRLGD